MPTLKGWRHERCGSLALQLKSGGLSLAVEGRRVIALSREGGDETPVAVGGKRRSRKLRQPATQQVAAGAVASPLTDTTRRDWLRRLARTQVNTLKTK
ncbi:MAG: hypothetical protein R3D02_06075 [Hyphomicrobiales bacterium]